MLTSARLIVRDIRSQVVFGNTGGMVLELDDGSLVNNCESDASPAVKHIRKSTDGGTTWVNKFTYSLTQEQPILRYLAKNGYIYFAVSNSSVHASIMRSTDNGETWAAVATSGGSTWWHMCEDSLGNLYANEYSSGAQDSTELYAYNIWKSTDHGATWSIFHAEPAQSSPGAKDGIRHVHQVSCDSTDQLYCGFGDSGTFGGNAGLTFFLNSDGMLGSQISRGTEGNGWPSFVECDDGTLLFGADNSPIGVYSLNRAANLYGYQMLVKRDLNTAYEVLFGELIKGRDGVIYGLTAGGTANHFATILASPDDGKSWQQLIYYDPFSTIVLQTLTVNRNGPSGKIFIGRERDSSIPYASFPDFTRNQLKARRPAI